MRLPGTRRPCCALATVALHADVQRLDAGDGEEGVHRRHRRAEIAQRHRARLGGEGEVAEILVEVQAMIGRLRLGQRREFAALRPVELSRTPPPCRRASCRARRGTSWWSGVTMSAPHSIGRHRIRRGQRVVDDQRHAGVVRDRRRSRSRSTTTPPGLARLSTKIALQRGVSARRKFSGSAGSTKWQVQPSFLKRQPELGQRAAIEIARGEEFVARLQQGEERQELRGVARRGGHRRAPALQAATRSSSTDTVGLVSRV